MTPRTDAPTTLTTAAMAGSQLSRRAVVGGALAVGAGGLLVGCGSDEEPTDDSSATTTTSGGTPTEDATATADATATEDGGAAAGATVLAATADVPVGGGLINTDAKVVVTQPEQGEFKGFSAVCTHQSCTVATVADGLITCPCHQSKFSITDGSVQGGPAPSPLPAVAVAVDGANVVAS